MTSKQKTATESRILSEMLETASGLQRHGLISLRSLRNLENLQQQAGRAT